MTQARVLPRSCSTSMPQSTSVYPDLVRHLCLKAQAFTPILFDIYASKQAFAPILECFLKQEFISFLFDICAATHKRLPRSCPTSMPRRTKVYPDPVRHICLRTEVFTTIPFDIDAARHKRLHWGLRSSFWTSMPQDTSVYPEPTRYLCLRAQACTPIPFDVYASKHMVPQITSVCPLL